VLPLRGAGLLKVQPGTRLWFRDARQARRCLVVDERVGENAWGTCQRTAYVRPGIALREIAQAATEGRSPPAVSPSAEWEVGALPPTIAPLLLRPDDFLVLTADDRRGYPARYDDRGQVAQPATIGCTLPQALADVREGERIWFDDGRIGGSVVEARGHEVVVRITQAAPQGSKLLADKGINLPDTKLQIAALTGKDLADLQFAARHADLIGLSFVHHADDVRMLDEELTNIGATKLGIVLKIETHQAFQNLPELVLAAMCRPRIGVMIARGVRLRSAGGTPGGDPVDLRGRSRPRRLGDPGAGTPDQGRFPVASGDHRRRDG
jgi:pyruvate kinase